MNNTDTFTIMTTTKQEGAGATESEAKTSPGGEIVVVADCLLEPL